MSDTAVPKVPCSKWGVGDILSQLAASAEGDSKMAARRGEAIYWTATLVAGLIVAWSVWSYVSNTESGEPVLPIIPLLFAGVIWLAGWAVRKLLAGR